MNKIDTTLYINRSVFERIRIESRRKGMEVNDFIVCLLKMKNRKFGRKMELLVPVKYQERDVLNKWKIHHIRFDPLDYEVFNDCRRFFKISVSLMLKMALDDYFSGKSRKIKNLDNYLICDYFIVKKIEQNFEIWQIYWERRNKTRKNE